MALSEAAPNGSNIRHRRPSSPSSSSSSPSPSSPRSTLLSQAAEKTVAAVRLLHWDDLPEWRRDNAFLLTSYRPATPSLAAIGRSACCLHNETVNIWTHLLGAVLFAGLALWPLWAHMMAATVPRYGWASGADVLVFGCNLAGAVACLAMSATYHAVSGHSEAVARMSNKLDYSGIVFLTVGSFVPALYYGFFCRPVLMGVYMAMIGLVGLGCTLVSWLEAFRTPAWRPYRAAMFVGLGLSGVLPVSHGLAMDGYRVLDQRMGLSFVLLEAALYILGAVLYALRWPERSFPRTFDVWGSSHQIFHLCVVAAAVSHLYGMVRAFDHHHAVTGARCWR